MGAKAPRGRIAASITTLLRERDDVARRLRGLDEEIAQVRRAFGMAPDTPAEVTCEICKQPFVPARSDQRLCSPCRQTTRRSVDEAKTRADGHRIIEATCLGIGHEDDVLKCAKVCRRPANRRGPVRCADCQLAQKRLATRQSLENTRAKLKAAAKSGERPPRPRQPSESALGPRVLAALTGGPVRPGPLSYQLHVSTVHLKQVVETLARQGKVTVVGNTNQRRIALA
jgi:hypothetical protein